MICLVINNETNEQVNIIVAHVGELAPDGCRLIELIDGMYWDGLQLSPIPVVVEE